MEIFSRLGIDWRLLVWQAINFGLVLFVLKRYAFGPITAVLGRRAERIARGLAAAEAAEQLRRDAARERKAVLDRARAEAGEIVADARGLAEKLKSESVEKTRRELATLVAQGRATLAAEKEALIEEARGELAAVVVRAVARLLPRETGPADQERMLRAAAAAVKEKAL